MIVNFYFNSAIIGIWYLLSKYWKRMGIAAKSSLIVSLFLFLYALSISDGRTGFVFGLVITVVLAFMELWKKKKRYGLLFGFLVPWIAIVLISSHQRMDADLIKSEPRFFLWKSGFEVVKEKPVLGHGISSAQERFDVAREKYQTQAYKEQWVASEHLDSHNQFIQTWMEFGLIGLLLLLAVYLAPLFLVTKRRKTLTLFFTALCMFQSFFDMFVTGFFSAIFCLWLIFLLRTGENDEQTNSKKLFTLDK
ncbi:MAG: O-antigen ligase family protein [Paludibacteraceae bacterium]